MTRGRAAALAVVVVLLAALAYYFGLRGPPGGASPAAATATPIAASVGSPAPSPSTMQLSEDVIEGGNLTLSYGAGYTPVDMSSFWDNLTLANSSSATISRYIDWLDGALSQGNDGLYNFTYGSVSVPPPQVGAPVRYGAFNLPFGAQVVVFAYPSSSGLVVVLDGRIANQTAWLQALGRVATTIELPNGAYSGVLAGSPYIIYDYLYNLRTYEAAPLYTSYVLWRVQLQTTEYAIYEGQQVPVTVVVLLEEPIYTYNTTQVNETDFWSAADLAFWDIVGAPTFALAVNIEYAGDPMPQVLYDAVPTILWHTLSISYSYGPGGQPQPMLDYTPFAIQLVGVGVCSDQSFATASFMADALGATSAYVVSVKLNHAVSLLVFPPQLTQQAFEYYGAFNFINLTKYNVSGVVIDNTADNITPQMMQEYITWDDSSLGGWDVTQLFYPFADSTVVGFAPTNEQGANAMLYTGIPEALYQELPPLFQFPWTRYYIEAFNLTYMGQQYEQQFQQLVAEYTSWDYPKPPGNWTLADYYQYAYSILYGMLGLGNGLVEPPSMSYLP